MIWCGWQEEKIDKPLVKSPLGTKNSRGAEWRIEWKHLPSIDTQSGENVACSALLLTHINFLLHPASVWSPLFHNVRLIDGHISVKIGSIDPCTGKVGCKCTLGLHFFRFLWYQLEPLRALLWWSECIALSRDRNWHILIIISVGKLINIWEAS